MSEKDPHFTALLAESIREAVPYLTTFFLSVWGGVVNHITVLRNGRKVFKMRELAFDLIVSTFAGLLTFFFCKRAGIDETMSAILIAVSGHMGTRAIQGFEALYSRIIGVKDAQSTKL